MAQLSEAIKKAERFPLLCLEKSGQYKGTINSMLSRLLLELFFSSSSLYDTNRIKNILSSSAQLLLVRSKGNFSVHTSGKQIQTKYGEILQATRHISVELFSWFISMVQWHCVCIFFRTVYAISLSNLQCIRNIKHKSNHCSRTGMVNSALHHDFA